MEATTIETGTAPAVPHAPAPGPATGPEPTANGAAGETLIPPPMRLAEIVPGIGEEGHGDVILDLDTTKAILSIGFEQQRSLDHRHVADLSDSMENDEWLHGSNRLVFAPENGEGLRLVDGQHRANAYLMHLERGGEPFAWNLVEIRETAATAYSRLDARAKKRPGHVVAKAMRLNKDLKFTLNNSLSAAEHGIIYEAGGVNPYMYELEDGNERPRSVPYRECRRWVEDHMVAYLKLETLFQGTPKKFGKSITVLKSPWVLALVVLTLHEDEGENADRWRTFLTEASPGSMFQTAVSNGRGGPGGGKPWPARMRAINIARAWNGKGELSRGNLNPERVNVPAGLITVG